MKHQRSAKRDPISAEMVDDDPTTTSPGYGQTKCNGVACLWDDLQAPNRPCRLSEEATRGLFEQADRL